ncbi:MAG: inositol monophosphatase family protein [Candidatus Thorarchaeota archaeon]
MISNKEKEIKKVIEEAARIAGSFLKLMAFDKLRVFNTKEKSEDSGRFLTIFDKEAERLIRNTIHMYFPKSKIYSDAEKGEEFITDPTEITWFIDPLDGTKAFLKGQFAFVCESIAAWDKEGLMASGIYNPFTEMLYLTTRNSEVYLNSEPLPKPEAIEQGKGRILIDFASDVPENIKFGLSTADLRKELGRILRFDGSIAQHLALIAQGTLDGAVIWGTGNKGAYWDLAAALLLLSRQGIKVTDLNGNEIHPSDKTFDQLVIAEPKLHQDLLNWIKEIKDFVIKTDDAVKKKKFLGLFNI